MNAVARRPVLTEPCPPWCTISDHGADLTDQWHECTAAVVPLDDAALDHGAAHVALMQRVGGGPVSVLVSKIGADGCDVDWAVMTPELASQLSAALGKAADAGRMSAAN